METVKTILLVEDSPGDIRLTQEAFRDADGALRLHVAVDGVEAVSFLRCEGEFWLTMVRLPPQSRVRCQ